MQMFFKAILKPTKGYQVQHLARTCAKKSQVIVKAKANLVESIAQIILRHLLKSMQITVVN